MVGGWIAQHDLDEVMAEFEKAEAAIAPIYDISQILEDPQYQALESITTVGDPELGDIKMQNVMFRMSETPGGIRWTGRRLGEDNEAIFCDELGLSRDELAALRDKAVV